MNPLSVLHFSYGQNWTTLEDFSFSNYSHLHLQAQNQPQAPSLRIQGCRMIRVHYGCLHDDSQWGSHQRVLIAMTTWHCCTEDAIAMTTPERPESRVLGKCCSEEKGHVNTEECDCSRAELGDMSGRSSPQSQREQNDVKGYVVVTLARLPCMAKSHKSWEENRDAERDGATLSNLSSYTTCSAIKRFLSRD